MAEGSSGNNHKRIWQAVAIPNRDLFLRTQPGKAYPASTDGTHIIHSIRGSHCPPVIAIESLKRMNMPITYLLLPITFYVASGNTVKTGYAVIL